MKKLLLSQFNFHHKLYNNVLDDFTDEETNRRLYGDKKINHVKYIAGHLLNSQYGFSFLAGLHLEVKWDELFVAVGKSKARDDINYPSIQEIKAEWNDIYKPSKSALENLPDKTWNQKPPKPMDKIFENSLIFENTVAGFLAFLNHHQAYHIGQIGILRRGFGKEPMSYQ
ncbi:MAG: DinB family protein [Balneolaceae bacterium]